MASITSNLPEIRRNLNDLGQIMNLRRRPGGAQRRIGDEILDVVAVAIEVRTIKQQLDPSGAPLAPLKPRTIARKIRLGFPLKIGIETHRMLDLDEIRGDQIVTSSTASMTYGHEDEEKQKAEWFQDPSNPNQAPREFYDVGKDGEKLIDNYINDEVIDRQIKVLGG